jgi:hypothetical protein
MGRLYAAGEMVPHPTKEYVLETKLIETRGADDHKVTSMPPMTVFKGKPASIRIPASLVLGRCPEDPKPDQPQRDMGTLLRVRVSRGETNGVRLELAVYKEVERIVPDGGAHALVPVASLRAVQGVKLGKVVKLVLDHDVDHGTVQSWMEVVVKEAPAALEGKTTAAPCPPLSFLDFLTRIESKDACYGRGELIAPPAPPCCPAPLPPPSVYCPGALYGGAVSCCPPSACGPVPPPPSLPGPGCAILQCTVTEPVKPACPPATIRVVTEDGQARLEVQGCCGSCMSCENMVLKMPECGPIKVGVTSKVLLKVCEAHGLGCEACASEREWKSSQVLVCGPLLKAAADSVTTDQKGHVILEGHVRVKYHKDGQAAKVVADRVVVSLADGQLDIKSSADASE